MTEELDVEKDGLKISITQKICSLVQDKDGRKNCEALQEDVLLEKIPIKEYFNKMSDILSKDKTSKKIIENIKD